MDGSDEPAVANFYRLRRNESNAKVPATSLPACVESPLKIIFRKLQSNPRPARRR
jgi:hypothetical protein